MFKLFNNLTNNNVELVPHEFKCHGMTYFTKNLNSIKRPLNPDYDNQDVGGIVSKYLDVQVPVTLEPNNKVGYTNELLVVYNKRPIAYIAYENYAPVNQLRRKAKRFVAVISRGDYRVDNIKKKQDYPDVKLIVYTR